ncbi:bacteriochlorophyll 4-vinyl reductase [Halorhodospira halophila]|uniref:Bacteriochlorophyll 4-vinyl reductase n=1 Tax=Halorhodospira halophila (strain DSM 244 / SL1) TaxID=349124 RepID=A1WXH8_HALHL|nr:bacteriochlorophyll 4-vinyl reductase [Halorhodospira halophila]ABM62390.1 bacteriochlorophyll 4-vinyl reductase [Halorhodospira halophila SL1]
MAEQHHEARIGPNAILQVAAALRALEDEETARRCFDAAGLSRWFEHPPEEMVPETTVAALHQRVRRELGPERAERVMLDAGERTGEYVLNNRIPAPIRTLLRVLPPLLAGPLLLKAISQHAWTFVGSGQLTIRRGQPCLLDLAHNPVIADEQAEGPVCHWHAAAFEQLFRSLVNDRSTIRETQCAAAGDESCRFELHYR